MRRLIVLLSLAAMLAAGAHAAEGTSCGISRSGDLVAVVCRSPLFGRP